MVRKTIAVIVVIVLSSLAASHRWGDSAHAMGMLSTRGGRARHPIHLASGLHRYTLVVTATVLPPFRGDVEVELAGNPELTIQMAATGPVIDLGFRRRPHFSERTFRDVRAGDRIALWVVIGMDNRDTDGDCVLQFRDPDSGQSLLRIPINFDSPGEAGHAR